MERRGRVIQVINPTILTFTNSWVYQRGRLRAVKRKETKIRPRALALQASQARARRKSQDSKDRKESRRPTERRTEHCAVPKKAMKCEMQKRGPLRRGALLSCLHGRAQFGGEPGASNCCPTLRAKADRELFIRRSRVPCTDDRQEKRIEESKNRRSDEERRGRNRAGQGQVLRLIS